MKAIFILLLLLAASGCDNRKKEARAPEDYHEQAAVDAAQSGLAAVVTGLNQDAFTAHNEWMRVETITQELGREQRPKEMETLTKELKDATDAKAAAEQVYADHVQRIVAALKSARALLDGAAIPKSLKLLEAEIQSAERLISGLDEWRKRADEGARKLLDTTDSVERHDAQRDYYKAAKQPGDLIR
ncbi:hypothetical protein [Luteolibacter sp. Populi]|uniref:hypothetical protein n=1 Tax=Luteolibacter sp. Populi TaxID=3230487 RepID=UPI003467B7DE